MLPQLFEYRYLLSVIAKPANMPARLLSAQVQNCLKPGLHEPQLPVERSITLVSFIVQENKET